MPESDDAVTGAPTGYAALVAEAKAAEEGVTEGPWKVAGGADAWAVDVEPSNRTGVFVAGDLEIEADARFIVASRALVPRLRQAVVDLVEENERLREALLRAISIIHDFSSGAPMPKGERPCKPLHAALGGDNG